MHLQTVKCILKSSVWLLSRNQKCFVCIQCIMQLLSVKCVCTLMPLHNLATKKERRTYTEEPRGAVTLCVTD